MSLKGTEKDIPLKDIPKLRKAAAERNTAELAKYVNSGAISAEVYQKIIKEFEAIQSDEIPNQDVQAPQRKPKEKEKINLSKLIKGILSVFILLFSMSCGLVYVIEQYGKGIAVFFLFLWFWAFDYAFEKDTKSKTIEKLERENKILKDILHIYKHNNKGQ